MHIYKISQKINSTWDTYSAAVVIAENDEIAKTMHPNFKRFPLPFDESLKNAEEMNGFLEYWCDTWAMPEFVTVEYLGIAESWRTREIVCASYRPG